MTNRAIIEAYYRHANAGEWDAFCDLFAAEATVDEQLAGHIEGRETLRDMMKGFPDSYASFINEPRQIVVEGDRATAISHISARAAQYPDEPIEANVANYFEVTEGLITYMANFHDSRPFAPFLRQLGAS